MKQERNVAAIIFTAFTFLLIVGTFCIKLVVDYRASEEYLNHLWHRTDSTNLKCVIQLGHQDDTTSALLSGYNYHLLRLFSKSLDVTFDISLAGKEENHINELSDGQIDILVLPNTKRSSVPGIVATSDIDSTSIWLMAEEPKGRLRIAEKWISSYHNSRDHRNARKRFFTIYNPYRDKRAGRKLEMLSPYDNLVRAYADSIGWDWRLLLAVMYQESRFKIEAVSYKGAIGLMQIMPDSEKGEDLINPENSIRIGTRRLGTLTQRYRGIAKDPVERQKIALAAYNAGAGRMTDILNFAAVNGTNRASWDSLAAMIPTMRDSAAVAESDTVKLGTFNGSETLTYVERIENLFTIFKEIDANESR